MIHDDFAMDIGEAVVIRDTNSVVITLESILPPFAGAVVDETMASVDHASFEHYVVVFDLIVYVVLYGKAWEARDWPASSKVGDGQLVGEAFESLPTPVISPGSHCVAFRTFDFASVLVNSLDLEDLLMLEERLGAY